MEDDSEDYSADFRGRSEEGDHHFLADVRHRDASDEDLEESS